MKKKRTIVIVLAIMCLAGVWLTFNDLRASQADSYLKVIERIERAIGGEYQKQTSSELVTTKCYKDDYGNKIMYYVVKTAYYETDPSEVTGLNFSALTVLFDPDSANACREMVVQKCPAALFEMENKSYLCWTYSPEVSCILEYDCDAVSREDIIKMAESTK